MRILSSDMAMQSHHASSFSQKQTTSMTVWNTGEQPNPNQNRPISKEDKIHRGLQLAQLSQQPFDSKHAIKSDKVSKAEKAEDQLPPDLLKMKQAIESLMAWMSGKTVKMELFSDKDLQPKTEALAVSDPNAAAQAQNGSAAAPAPTWGAIIQSSSETAESESLSVAMQGGVTTADGRAINFTMSMSLSRSYYSQESMEVRLGAALKDPLVVNFDGQPAQLSLNKFNFDLSATGSTTEKLAELQGNSGYLALDRNGDGIINDGSELFGPQSGDGFAELAQLDDDGNGWIDEGDAAFAKLLVWQPTSDGSQKMAAIGQLGIGAIHTAGIDAKFDYKDSQNTLQGRMKQAGMFLYEDGRAGSIQQIDMAV